MPAANGRFGVMAAVAPQKRQCKFETLYPAGSVVEAATTPSRWDVVGNAAEVRTRTFGERITAKICTFAEKLYNLQWII